MLNYNYGSIIKPILKPKLDVSLIYQDSGKCYTVQSSDLIAGSTRRYELIKN